MRLLLCGRATIGSKELMCETHQALEVGKLFPREAGTRQLPVDERPEAISNQNGLKNAPLARRPRSVYSLLVKELDSRP